MGLLDSILGSLGQSQGAGGNPGAGGGNAALLNAVIGMLGQGGGGGGAGSAGGVLGGLGGIGGVIGLVEKFRQSGMGDAANSWVGTGQNMPISADQVTSALGHDTIGNLAQQLGMGHGEVAGQLSQMLPQLIDKLTPHGQLPQAGSDGGLGDLAGMLGGLLKR